jgi:hypothetical protein
MEPKILCDFADGDPAAALEGLGGGKALTLGRGCVRSSLELGHPICSLAPHYPLQRGGASLICVTFSIAFVQIVEELKRLFGSDIKSCIGSREDALEKRFPELIDFLPVPGIAALDHEAE